MTLFFKSLHKTLDRKFEKFIAIYLLLPSNDNKKHSQEQHN